MQSFVVALMLTTATVAFAQESQRPDARSDRTQVSRSVTRGGLEQIRQSLDNMESAMTEQMAAIRRDAFIVTRVVAAAGALNDFQVNSAIQRAIDEVNAAMLRAAENPRAPKSTFEMLEGDLEILIKARSQGSMANLPDIQRELLKRLDPLQEMMFRQVDEARRSRLLIGDIRTRLTRWDDAIDQAMIESLSASISYMKVAPK